MLTALREVEDYLVQLRVMEHEQQVQRNALESARESLRLARNQYEQGLIDYLSVAVLETTALNTERNAISLLGSRLNASVPLSLAFVLAIGVALWWAVFSGQYDDTEDQGAAILRDNDN